MRARRVNVDDVRLSAACRDLMWMLWNFAGVPGVAGPSCQPCTFVYALPRVMQLLRFVLRSMFVRAQRFKWTRVCRLVANTLRLVGSPGGLQDGVFSADALQPNIDWTHVARRVRCLLRDVHTDGARAHAAHTYVNQIEFERSLIRLQELSAATVYGTGDVVTSTEAPRLTPECLQRCKQRAAALLVGRSDGTMYAQTIPVVALEAMVGFSHLGRFLSKTTSLLDEHAATNAKTVSTTWEQVRDASIMTVDARAQLIQQHVHGLLICGAELAMLTIGINQRRKNIEHHFTPTCQFISAHIEALSHLCQEINKKRSVPSSNVSARVPMFNNVPLPS